MGDNIYIDYWQTIIPSIIERFENGDKIIHLPVKDLKNYGDRQSYYTNFRIVNGQIQISRNAYAQGRDFYTAFSQTEYFKENLSNSTIQVTISRDLQLKMEILATHAPDFFTEEDFEELNRFPKELYTDTAEHKETYEKLKATYAKVEYWAKKSQQKAFPQGSTKVLKRPTNRANKFEEYQWAKIFPDEKSRNAGLLAFTVGIDTDNYFQIKIDTIGLSDGEKLREIYIAYRGDYYNSNIVKLFPGEQILDKGWDYLVNLTANIIIDLKLKFDDVFNELMHTNISTDMKAETKSFSRKSLNTILYGPPGTGKTYNTIDSALEIVNENFYLTNKNNRKELTQKFNELLIKDFDKQEGQIAFCTFHQSMSYEDFVEGIKPDISQGEKEVSYFIEDGIFKKICRLASTNIKVEDNFIQVYNKLLQEIEENDGSLILKTPKMAKEFTIYENSKGNLRFHANTDKAYEGVIRKDFIETYLQTGVLLDWPSYTKSVGEYLKTKYEYKNTQKKEEKNYVLIIDEINRGNVSQILGELITLIEDDKRSGSVEAITVTLPYSKKPFSVPSNLYIIGTMNTADRSVEALDTALRRRFEFREMMPKPKLISPQRMIWKLWWDYKDVGWEDKNYLEIEKQLYALLGVPVDFDDEDKKEEKWQPMHEKGMNEDQIEAFNDVDFTGINYRLLLAKINERIEKILSKDQQIGHAFFINALSVEKLYNVFYQKIIPQLQEYFYGDFGKIGLILGNAFIKGQNNVIQFANFEYEDKELLQERKVYEINTFKNNDRVDLTEFSKAVRDIYLPNAKINA